MRYIFILAIVIITNATPLLSAQHKKIPYQAFVTVPVADLVGQPILKQGSYCYDTIPVCGGIKNPFLACIRMHQLLFNERVTVLQETTDEVMISITNAFYVTAQNKKTLCATYWTNKNNITALTPGIDSSKIPSAISYDSNAIENASESIITLIMPWHDPLTARTFSAGTRFVRSSKICKKNAYCVFIFNPHHNRFDTVTIPKERCIDHVATTPHERIQNFVHILRAWAHVADNSAIPYVWGGASFTKTVAPPFNLCTGIMNNQPTSWYEFPHYTASPKTGLDCSGMIMRAAQIAGVPYFYKNSIALETFVPPLTNNYPLVVGDLIAIPRHVMVVASIENNTLIEARSYPHGYGKVHEIALNKVFKGINTYAELRDAYTQGRTIYRLDSSGNVAESLPYVKLARLEGVFKKH